MDGYVTGNLYNNTRDRRKNLSMTHNKSDDRIGLNNKKSKYHLPASVYGYKNDSQQQRNSTIAAQLSNTAQLLPELRINTAQVREIIYDVLRRNLWEESYDPDRCNILAMILSEQIKSSVKSLKVPRYKIVCVVTVGSKSGQTYVQASRCLLNQQFDEFVSESFENGSVFAVAVVYAFYQE